MQGATYKIDKTDILRPLHARRDDKLALNGRYLLAAYTKFWVDSEGAKHSEKIRWLDEVKSKATGNKPWLLHQLTGTPFDGNRIRQ